jgi:hypothetical protein
MPAAPGELAPLCETISGIKVVVIPLTEYAELLRCQRELREQSVRDRVFNRLSQSSIERDATIATFLATRFGISPVRAILADCRAAYGPSRTPTKSAAYRYWARLRAKAFPPSAGPSPINP